MRSNKKADYERPSTIIGKDTILETATIKSKASIQVNGIVQGDLDVEASVVIGQGGKIKGNITAIFALIAGQVEGNVQAREQLHITKTAVITGDIICNSIIIDDGAVLNGDCKMQNTTSKDVKANTSKNNKK